MLLPAKQWYVLIRTYAQLHVLEYQEGRSSHRRRNRQRRTGPGPALILQSISRGSCGPHRRFLRLGIRDFQDSLVRKYP